MQFHSIKNKMFQGVFLAARGGRILVSCVPSKRQVIQVYDMCRSSSHGWLTIFEQKKPRVRADPPCLQQQGANRVISALARCAISCEVVHRARPKRFGACRYMLLPRAKKKLSSFIIQRQH